MLMLKRFEKHSNPDLSNQVLKVVNKRKNPCQSLI